MHAMKAIPSTYHQNISYLTASGQVDLQGSQLEARQCYQLSIHGREKDKEPDISFAEAHPSLYKLRPAVQAASEDREQLVIDPLHPIVVGGPDRCTYASSLLTEKEKAQLQQALTENADVFAWNHAEMTGVNLENASHKLNVLPSARPIRQKVRRFHPDRHQIIQAEVDNLLKAGFIREVKYPEWLSNVVVVPKKGGKWRVCVDYTDLNDACPKDSFPLPPH